METKRRRRASTTGERVLLKIKMTDIIKRLKVCFRWFQQVDETHLQEKENLRSSLESAEKRFSDKELDAKTKE
ncbi:hypothetical protein Bca101_027101 [Brassica carinata]